MRLHLTPALVSALCALSACRQPPAMIRDTKTDASNEAETQSELAQASLELPNADLFRTTQRIHELIRRQSPELEPDEMRAYEVTIPLADDAALSMMPIPGGVFTMGSGAPDAPKVEVELDPFWMAEFEITWDLYQDFMENSRIGHNQNGGRNKSGTWDLDGDRMSHEAPNFETGQPLPSLVTQPTPPYLPMNLGMGNGYEKGYPAVAMSHYAASKFCAWLSAQTGQFYRLPTEAEWEYACRAGSTTSYAFGDEPTPLGDFAFFIDNANFNPGSGLEEYAKVGQKKPNAWGLHDMHGNVAEWTLDAYDPAFYQTLQEGARNPWNPPVARYPRVVRGGSFLDEAEALKSAARRGSKAAWNKTDPQLPKSIWYLTDAPFVGFRVVRPLKTPSAEAMHRYWNSGPGTPAE